MGSPASISLNTSLNTPFLRSWILSWVLCRNLRNKQDRYTQSWNVQNTCKVLLLLGPNLYSNKARLNHCKWTWKQAVIYLYCTYETLASSYHAMLQSGTFSKIWHLASQNGTLLPHFVLQLLAMCQLYLVTKVWIFFGPFGPKAHLPAKFLESQAVNNGRGAWRKVALYYVSVRTMLKNSAFPTQGV